MFCNKTPKSCLSSPKVLVRPFPSVFSLFFLILMGFTVLGFLGMAVTAVATDFKITQLTNDNTHDLGPSVYDGTIAWERLNQIYYWDGADIRNVSNNSTTNDSPSLYDGTIAWRAFDGHDWEIYYAELVTQSPPVADAGDNIVLISESQSSTALYGTAADPDDDPLIYRRLLRSYGPVRLLGSVHAGVTASGLPQPD